MATRTVKARVALDGEREYKQALDSLNQGNRVLASEMKKLQAEYKGNTDSTEFLTKKGELLERQLLSQQDKVKTLREAMQRAVETYGESSKEAMGYQIQLNNAEAAQYDLEAAIRENNQEMEQQGNLMASLSGTVEGLAQKLGIQLPQGAQSALDAMKGMSNGSAVAIAAVGAAVTAAVAAVKQLMDITREAAAEADDLITQSMTSGVSTRTLQAWKYAENLVDVSVETMTGSLTKLTKNMAEAKDGNSQLAETFRDLGVSITDQDGALRDAESVFYDIIDALGEVENQTERDALSMEIFGKSAQELNPLILQGSDALRDFAAEAEATGYVLDQSQLQKLGEVDDAYAKLNLTVDGLKKELAAQFAPAVKDVMEKFTQWVQKAGDFLTKSGLVKGVGELLQYTTAILDPLTSLLDLSPELSSGLQPLYTVVHGIAGAFAWLADAVNAGIGALTYFTRAGRERWNTALGYNAPNGQYSNLQKWYGDDKAWEDWRSSGYSGYRSQGYGYDASTGQYYDIETGNYIYGHNAGGTNSWRGGLTWVGEGGPELVALPRGSQILNNQESRNIGGGDTFNISISAQSVQEFNDIIEICRSARVRRRMEG